MRYFVLVQDVIPIRPSKFGLVQEVDGVKTSKFILVEEVSSVLSFTKFNIVQEVTQPLEPSIQYIRVRN